ncbi:unnamed protein product, partial [Ectocarpus sp. 8 AP-2014]
NIEKFTIRTINSDGRLSARDLAIVTSKQLFLKRNLPVACRRLVAEQTRLAAEVGGAVAGGGESKAAGDERRLSAIRARIAAQQEKCLALEQEGGGGGKTVVAAAAAGGPSWPPSKARVKLSFLEMQEEGMLLRLGGVQGARDNIRGAPAVASNGASGARKAAAGEKKNGPAARGGGGG